MQVVEGIGFTDRDLIPVWEKVLGDERLSQMDGMRLFETQDFPAVGRMADYVKTQRDGDRVFFVLNRQLNPTNICVLSCSFCDFAKKKGDPDAYEMSMEEILAHVDEDTRAPSVDFQRAGGRCKPVSARIAHPLRVAG